MNDHAARIVEQLGLAPLPGEGGFFRRTWTSAQTDSSGRGRASSILFLLTETDFSAFHRLGMEELWFFHAGDPVEHVTLDGADGGSPRVALLGPDIASGHNPQVAIAAGVWQGARLQRTAIHGWALVSCVVVPAWDERECELGERSALARAFPRASEWIERLTR
jgi:hypothetical protein